MDFVVYYDKDYPTWWINRALSLKIATFLSQNNFQIKDSGQLATWMENAVKTYTAHNCVIVFSQDVVPDTVCHSPAPSTLVRAFLDLGGRIVWIGDNPFYYQGLSKNKIILNDVEKEKLIASGVLAQNRAGEIARQWGLDGPYGVLGVIPIFMPAPSDKVKITRDGKNFGFRNSWYSNRPIIKKGLTLHKRLSVLGHSKPILPIPTNKILPRPKEKSEVTVPTAFSSLSGLLGLVPAIGTAVAAVISYVTGGFAGIYGYLILASIASAIVYIAYWSLRQKETYASAWLKNFNDKYSQSGFLRIWDFEPREVTDEMLRDLLKVAVHK
ncbi:MAG: hypothetical protein ABSB71_12315 [Candidatus Bathyarchaeia archaeon]